MDFHFFLFVVDQKLAEQTEVIIKADTVSRQAKRCDRIKEACCQTAETSVSKGRLHFHLLDLGQLSSVSCKCFSTSSYMPRLIRLLDSSFPIRNSAEI